MLSKRLVGSLLALAFVVGFGALTLGTPVQAKPDCTYFCDYSTGIATVCCVEWVPTNPDCRGRKCPGDYELVCHEEPCDYIQ
jgi:hypothetical protein